MLIAKLPHWPLVADVSNYEAQGVSGEYVIPPLMTLALWAIAAIVLIAVGHLGARLLAHRRTVPGALGLGLLAVASLGLAYVLTS